VAKATLAVMVVLKAAAVAVALAELVVMGLRALVVLVGLP
jgi:hypothetical protein